MSLKNEFSILKQAKELESETNEFLDLISQASLVFNQAIALYQEPSEKDNFISKVNDVTDKATRVTNLRRSLEVKVYIHTLIPDARGDVLKLLESMNILLHNMKSVLWYFETEQPLILDELKIRYINISESVLKCVEYLVYAVRAFFSDRSAVKNYLHKVYFYEDEIDAMSRSLKQDVFNLHDISLAQKIHLRFFVERIEWLSDEAEDIADSINIYLIKRA